ncbi:hypothetical protein ALT1644_40163 [Alteromonas macleodii]
MIFPVIYNLGYGHLISKVLKHTCEVSPNYTLITHALLMWIFLRAIKVILSPLHCHHQHCTA